MSEKRHALVLAFGDLGHSPRMQNHVRELIRVGYSVTFAGYMESPLPEDICVPSVRLLSLPVVSLRGAWWLPKPLRLGAHLVVKIFLQLFYVLWTGLFRISRPNVILVQSPPSLPTLLVCPLLAFWHRSLYIVDWHNVGYTILAQSVKMPAVIALAKAIELYLSRFAHISLVVSKAQQQWMLVNVGIKSLVVYDRPNTELFRPLGSLTRREFRQKFADSHNWDLQDDSPLVVSSTSWTPDEDFGLFAEALGMVEERLRSSKKRLYVVITGKGPLKEPFEERIAKMGLSRISVITRWLSYEEYALLLGSADLGVSLHSSSSGVDLPMKVIDMIAVDLPVIAYHYPAIEELVRSDRLFSTPAQLAGLIIRGVIENNLEPDPQRLESWSQHWRTTVLPLLK